MPVADWKAFKIFGNFGKFCASNVPSILFRFSECLDPLLEKNKNIPISVPGFVAWDFFIEINEMQIDKRLKKNISLIDIYYFYRCQRNL